MKVGIDLGTTFSLISKMEATGEVSLIPDNTFGNQPFTPSVVHIESNQALVGQPVNAMLEQNPSLPVIRFFKRYFGEPSPIFYDSSGASWYPESIAALVLKKLRFDAEGYASQLLEGAVITIPAHFSDPQRKAVINAANMVGLPIYGLVEEPVAAALHYGVLNQAKGKVILVYDLGGGTFDVTLMSMDEEGVYVIAKDGLTELGGKEFDEKIADMILDQYKQKAGVQVETNAKNLLELRKLSEEIKIELCMPGIRYVKRLVLLDGVPLEIYITRQDFETAIQEAIEETLHVLKRCVAGANLQINDVDVVLLVGGSSMVPTIKTELERLFTHPKHEIRFHEPMKAVACGAAVHMSQLTGEAAAFDIPPALRGVSGHHLGVRVIDSRSGRTRVDVLIRKNLPLPISVTKTYYTTRPNQTRMVISFVQFLSDEKDLIQLGDLIVGPLPPQQNYPIEVTIQYQEDGTVHVQAWDPRTGMEMQQTFCRQNTDLDYLYTQKLLVNDTMVNGIG